MSSIRSDGPTRFEKEFMARLIARRKKLGVTQVELARRAGMTQPNLARYESLRYRLNHKKPSPQKETASCY